jgi:hypothetical protein
MIMRVFSAVLGGLAIGAACAGLAACADQAPVTPPPPSIPVAASAAPVVVVAAAPGAAPVAGAAAAQDPAAAALEKHFLSEGYKIEIRNGQKMFCRREETMGTHLGSSQKYCSTPEQLAANEAQAKELVERYQRQQVSGPSSK